MKLFKTFHSKDLPSTTLARALTVLGTASCFDEKLGEILLSVSTVRQPFLRFET